jgi:sphingomyelin phosphodiesterase 4
LNYVSLIEDIFSFGSHSMTSEWGLKLISKNFNPREFDSIFSFLHINGSLFQLIRQLMNDPLNRYEFPKSCLPVFNPLFKVNLFLNSLIKT